MIKNLIKTNIVSIIMLIAVIVVYFVIDILPLSLVLLAIWLGYTLWANLSLFSDKEKDIDLEKMVRFNEKYRYFFDDGMVISNCSKMAEERIKVLDELDVVQESILTTADKIKRQLDTNAKHAVMFIKAYDYNLKPDASYLSKIRASSLCLYNKLNELIELVLKNEKSTEDIDLSSVDDILESLKEVSEL